MNVGDYSRGRDQGGDIKEQETPWHIAGCLPSRGSQTGATREMRLERSPTVPCKVQSEKQLAVHCKASCRNPGCHGKDVHRCNPWEQAGR